MKNQFFIIITACFFFGYNGLNAKGISDLIPSHTDDFELIKLAIIDVEKANKILRRQDVTAEDEHVLRDLFNPIKTKINASKHTDNIEGSSYIQEQNKKITQIF